MPDENTPQDGAAPDASEAGESALHVDEDWKAEARRDREKLEGESGEGERPVRGRLCMGEQRGFPRASHRFAAAQVRTAATRSG